VDYHKLDDNALIRLMARRQEGSLSELYDRYSRLVYSIALSVLDDEALAEEVTQDVFLRAWDKAATFDAHLGKVSTWLASVARHRAIDVLRSRRARPEGKLAGFSIDEALNLPALDDVEGEVERGRRGEQVRRAMAQLPEAQRRALAYAYLLGFSHSQIAEELNEPLGTVKTRIRLAMQTLRKLLADDAPAADQE
jgi:RNA polymerase sigma-70 factor (ECF subfamily)